MAYYTEEDLEYKHMLEVPILRKTFGIKAGHDAHIALTSGPNDTTPMIEIFLGGWSGQKSAIRLNKEKPEKAQVDTPDILDGSEFRNFVLEWTTSGKVQVYLEGAKEPFLSWTNPEPFPITHYGIRTSWGATGDWLIDGVNEAGTEDSLDYLYNPIDPRGGRLEFEVKASNDAHICLTSGLSAEAPIHEIFLGGWSNSKSVIRHNKEKPEAAEAETPGILDEHAFKRFWIEWNSFEINVGHGGEIIPFLSWKNRVAHPVTHFGILTFYGSDGYWQIFETSDKPVEALSVEAVQRPPRDAPTGELRWVPAEAGNVPEGAVVSGSDSGETLYVARASHEGEVIPGKLHPAHGVCYIPWGSMEHGKEEYEVLVANPDSVSWVAGTGGDAIPENAVSGGVTVDGEVLYIGRANHEGTLTSGKVQPSHGNLYISYGGVEVGFSDYEILVQN